MLFAPALFLVSRLLGRRDRRLEAPFAVLVILVVAALRFSSCAARLGPERPAGRRCFASTRSSGAFCSISRSRRRAADALDDASADGAWALARAAWRSAIPASSSASRSWRSRAASSAQQAFPYVSAAFGMIAVGVALAGRGPFPQSRRQRRELLSRPHLLLGLSLPPIVIMALKPMIATAPLRAAAGGLCRSRSSRCRRSSSPDSSGRSWRRGPITAPRVAPPRRLPRRSREASPLALRVAAHHCRLALRRSRRRARPQRLHGRQALRLLSAARRDGGSRPCARGADAAASPRRARRGGARASFCSRSRCRSPTLSTARSTGLPLVATIAAADLFLSRRARQSGRVRHLVVLLSQRMDPGRRHQGGDRCAGPAEEAALRPRSGQLGAHVRHHDPHQQSRLSRAGLAARQGRRLSHCRARRVADLRARRCATARSPGPNCCRICSTATPRAAA